MKKLLMVGILLGAMTVWAEAKIGTVDMVILVKSHKSYESNRELIRNTQSDYQKKFTSMQASLEGLQDEGRKLMDEARSPMISDAAKKTIEKRLMDIQERFVRKQQEARAEAARQQQELSDLEARLLKMQGDDIKKTIAEYAKANGYDLILDSMTAHYVSANMDVTDEILKNMGLNPQEARAKIVAEAKDNAGITEGNLKDASK